MVDPLRCPLAHVFVRASHAARGTAIVVFLSLATGPLAAQQPAEVHYWHQGVMPPGAIGSLRLERGGSVAGFFQPVEIKAPAGVAISLVEGGGFGEPMPAPVLAGMLIGPVYRLRVANLPLHPGAEVFPTIEVIDRLYAPRGQETRFPIEIELTQEEMEMALEGKFVTRVIYLEDPDKALPVRQDPNHQAWFEAGPGRDPLAMADELGRPVAILRLGGRVPENGAAPSAAFLFGCPPIIKYARPLAAGTPKS